MDDEETSRLEIWATRLISIFFTVSLLYCAMIVEIPDRGRLWDKLASYIPHATAPIGLALEAPQQSVMTSPQNAPNLTPVVAEKTAPAPVKPEKTPVKAARIQETATPTPHLTTALRTVPIYDDNPPTFAFARPNKSNVYPSFDGRTSDITSAGVNISMTPALQAPPPDQTFAQTQTAPASVTPRPVPITTGYGSAGRNEIMVNAAGPVHNFKNNAKQ